MIGHDDGTVAAGAKRNGAMVLCHDVGRREMADDDRDQARSAKDPIPHLHSEIDHVRMHPSQWWGCDSMVNGTFLVPEVALESTTCYRTGVSTTTVTVRA